MRSVAILILLVSCKSTDVQPDEFRVDYGHGDMNVSGSRPDMYEDMYSVGLTWYIGDVAKRDHEEAFEEFMRTWQPEVVVKQEPPVVVAPEPAAVAASEQEPEHKKPAPLDWWPMFPGIALAVLGALLKEKH
jgi:hypothetical protein